MKLERGHRHSIELPCGWFLVIDMREEINPWIIEIRDSWDERVGDEWTIPRKSFKQSYDAVCAVKKALDELPLD